MTLSGCLDTITEQSPQLQVTNTALQLPNTHTMSYSDVDTLLSQAAYVHVCSVRILNLPHHAIGIRLHNGATSYTTGCSVALPLIHCCLVRQPGATRAAQLGNWTTENCLVGQTDMTRDARLDIWAIENYPVMQLVAKTQENCVVS